MLRSSARGASRTPCAVRQVARVLIRHRPLQRPAWRLKPHLNEIGAQVAHARGELFGAGGVGRVVAQQVSVLTQLCPAARRVHHHDLVGIGGKHVKVVACELARRLQIAPVCVQRPAATLRGRRRDPDPVAAQHPRAGVVRLRVEDWHHAAREQRRPAARRAGGCVARHVSGLKRRGRQHGRLCVRRGHPRREPPQHPAALHDRPGAAAPVQSQRPPQPPQPRRPRPDSPHQHAPEQSPA